MRSLTLLAIIQAGQLALAAPALFPASLVQARHLKTVEAFEADFYRNLEERNADESQAVESCFRITLPDPKFHRGPRTPSIVEIISCPPREGRSKHDQPEPKHGELHGNLSHQQSDHTSIEDVCAARAAAEATRQHEANIAGKAGSGLAGEAASGTSSSRGNSGGSNGGTGLTGSANGPGINGRPVANDVARIGGNTPTNTGSTNGNDRPADSNGDTSSPPGSKVDEDIGRPNAGTVHAATVKGPAAKSSLPADSCSTGTPAQIAVCVEASVESPAGDFNAGTRDAVTFGGSKTDPQTSAKNCSTGTATEIAACIHAAIRLPGDRAVAPTSMTSSSATSTNTQSSSSPTSTAVDCSISDNASLAVCLKAVVGM